MIVHRQTYIPGTLGTRHKVSSQGISWTLTKEYWIKRLESNYADVLEMYERQTGEAIKLYNLGGSL